MNAALVVGYIALKRENRDLIREEGGMEPLCKILNNEYYREERVKKEWRRDAQALEDDGDEPWSGADSVGDL